MQRILTAAQMKEADARTIEGGIPSLVLMERAAMAVVHTMAEYGMDLRRAIVLCGTGNNGGDGLAVARIMCDLGYEARIVAIGNADHFSTERKQQENMLKPYHIPVFNSFHDADPGSATVIIDALFGIGVSRKIEGNWKVCIEEANASGIPIVSIDMPSGIHTDTGALLGTAIHAELTVTFSVLKAGLLLYPGREYSGEVAVREIGIRTQEESSRFCAVMEADLDMIPPRDESGNKGTFGKTLVIAGSRTICGAAYLSAEAALRTGTGMVKIYTEEANRVPLAASFPEALLSTYSETAWEPEGLSEDLKWADTVLIGPGIGCSDTARQIVEYVLQQHTMPLVMDADALNLLNGELSVLRDHTAPLILTPHCGEMSRLNGRTVAEIKEDLRKTAEEAAAASGATVVLKDASTVIASPDGRTWVYAGGNSALATAGSGDVLAGIMAGLLTQFRNTDLPYAALAVCLHGCCGVHAAELRSRSSVLAGDLTACLSEYL